MQCDQVRSLLHRYVDGELNDTRADALEMHLAHCSACQSELQELRSLVSETELAFSNSEAPPNFEDGVARALRPHTKTKGGFLQSLRNLPKNIGNAVRCL